MTRKLLQKFVYFVLPVLLGVLFFLSPNKDLFSKIGNLALIMFAVTLFISPLSVLFPIKPLKILMTYRRELGLATFFFYFFHGLGFINLYNLDPVKTLSQFNKNTWGMFAGICLSILAITSNDTAVKILKSWWKKIHRLAYPAYYLVLWHVSLAKNDFTLFYVLGVTYSFLKLGQFLKSGRI